MNRREPYWDNLKLILIFLVVLGHFLIPVYDKGRSIKTVYNYIYLFHMPAFIFVSGCFSKSFVRKDDKAYKLAGFLALYCLFTAAIGLLQFIFTGKYNINTFLSNSQAPWYMLGMFFWYLLIIFFSRLSPAFAMPACILFSLAAGAYSECGTFLSLSKTIVYFPFFLAGYYFDRNLPYKIRPWMRIVALAVMLSALIGMYFYLPLIAGQLGIIFGSGSYQLLGFSNLYGMMLRTVWYIVAFIMTGSLLCLVPAKRFGVTCIGERTLGIYVVHRLMRDVFMYLGVYQYLGHGFVLLLACIAVSCIMVFITSGRHITGSMNRLFHMDFIMKGRRRGEEA